MIKAYIYADAKGISKIKTISDIPFQFNGISYIVPKGFISDGASIPKMFWSLIAPCIDGRTIRAAVIHDYLYHTGILSRADADKVFLNYLLQDDFPLIKSYICYGAVRVFGSSHYLKK